ncbi:MAG: PSD1 domain-containing protein [Planctomycetaceae bacterium]|nr:PSD1 domain-containing protein [Planctomycetaceae bacterium]
MKAESIRIPLLILTIAVILTCLSATQIRGESQLPSDGEKLFALKVQPLFREKCLACHGSDPGDLKSQFDMRTRDAMLAGGEGYDEGLIIPGDASQSLLMGILDRTDVAYTMPPKEADRLTQEEVWAVRDWINAGAPWPDDQRVKEIYEQFAKGVRVATSGGLSESWTNRKYDPEDLWSFQPIQNTFEDVLGPEVVPTVDAFIERQLSEKRLTPAPLADRTTLVRRATFDLTGLPPTPHEIQQFLNDPRDDEEAFAALVDRLLESPRYGEQWARHWLDVARYADSSGYANDYERPNAWRYRDYVIRAFNRDLPFDQFVREQLAGDELITQAADQGEPLSEQRQAELLVATGFLRMGPWEHTGMSVAKITRQLFLDDITDTVGQVFLGHALQCCRCHDHKFDPIPTRDYYAIQAAFATTQFAEVETAWFDSENRKGMPEDRHYHELRHQANQALLKDLDERKQQYEQEWFRERGLPYQSKAEAKKAGAAAEDLPNRTFKTADEYGRERIGRKWQSRFSWEFDRYKPIALTVYNGATRVPRANYGRIDKPADPLKGGELEQTAILSGGDPFSPTQPVSPGPLSAVPGSEQFELPNEVNGRRLALAEWIVDPENTLTSRVLANRIWAHHFGQGIAGNPNNFGATGKPPTHPALLDWLATEVVENGWSIKHLHRVIMLSSAYRRSTQHPDPEFAEKNDPQGTSYAVFRPRRLTAEEIRDAMLAVSGELNLEMGGIPARPDMNLEAALQPRMIMGTFAPSYVPHPLPEQRNRRTIYTHHTRGQRMPFLETFNQPGSERPCEQRDQSNITPQVFALWNGQETNDRALAMAVRVLKETDTDQRTIERAFSLALGRPATDDEIRLTLQHWQAMTDRQQQLTFLPTEYPTEVVREANEENTGEIFTFTEKLFVYEDYVPDPQPHEFNAKTRALADVCLALLNSNEFLYVY